MLSLGVAALGTVSMYEKRSVIGESYYWSDSRGRFLSPKCKAFCYTETVPE